jgi:plastocyanin
MTTTRRLARGLSSIAIAVAIGASAVFAPAAVGSGAYAEEFVISQKKRKFSPKVVTAKIGDTVVFLNDDRFAHNLFSESKGFEFDVRKQMPGDRHTMTLERKGTFEVRCAIHPRMRMKITVE